MATRPKNSNYGSETIVIGGEEEEDYSNIVEDLVPKYDPFSGPSHRLDEEEEPDERISEITLHVDEDEEEPDESSIERAKKVILILKQVYFDKRFQSCQNTGL